MTRNFRTRSSLSFIGSVSIVARRRQHKPIMISSKYHVEYEGKGKERMHPFDLSHLSHCSLLCSVVLFGSPAWPATQRLLSRTRTLFLSFVPFSPTLGLKTVVLPLPLLFCRAVLFGSPASPATQRLQREAEVVRLQTLQQQQQQQQRELYQQQQRTQQQAHLLQQQQLQKQQAIQLAEQQVSEAKQSGWGGKWVGRGEGLLAPTLLCDRHPLYLYLVRTFVTRRSSSRPPLTAVAYRVFCFSTGLCGEEADAIFVTDSVRYHPSYEYHVILVSYTS